MTDLATRYGTRSRAGRGLLITGVTLLALVFLGWLAWVIFHSADPEVTSDMMSFQIVDEHTATATFTAVRHDPDVAASCLLRAQAPDHSIVGELDLAVGPGGPERQTITKTMRTERKATTVDLVGCTAPGQNRPR